MFTLPIFYSINYSIKFKYFDFEKRDNKKQKTKRGLP